MVKYYLAVFVCREYMGSLYGDTSREKKLQIRGVPPTPPPPICNQTWNLSRPSQPVVAKLFPSVVMLSENCAKIDVLPEYFRHFLRNLR